MPRPHSERPLSSESTTALQVSDKLAQLTVLVGAMEELAPGKLEQKTEHYPWRVARIAAPRWLRGRIGSVLFSPQMERTLSVVMFGSAVVLLVANPKSRFARATRLVQLSAHIYQHSRAAGFGRDGSDHALVVQDGAQLVAAFAKPGSRVERMALGFLGAQALLAYFTSGFVKAISPVWRAGQAMSGVMRTSSYGDAKLHRFLRKYPAVEKAAAWGVIVGETAVPLLPFAPRWLRRLWHLGLLGMHAGIARYMGLNRFFWSFAALQAPLGYVLDRLSRFVRK